jgi:hypothetical protein
MFDPEGRNPMTAQIIATATARTAGQAIPVLSSGTRERMRPAGVNLWRVLDASGHVIGHVETFGHPLGVRFRAKRYHTASAGFRELGEFWSADDAVACLRYSA